MTVRYFPNNEDASWEAKRMEWVANDEADLTDSEHSTDWRQGLAGIVSMAGGWMMVAMAGMMIVATLGGKLLQHGTILTGNHHPKMFPCNGPTDVGLPQRVPRLCSKNGYGLCMTASNGTSRPGQRPQHQRHG